MIGADNELVRDLWLRKVLAEILQGKRILDAGAGELANKKYCQNLDYISQDICQYEGAGDGKGLQTSTWDTSQIDIVCDVLVQRELDFSGSWLRDNPNGPLRL